MCLKQRSSAIVSLTLRGKIYSANALDAQISHNQTYTYRLTLT
jgi:DNA-binding CsgD family transcriptional regulator